MHRKREWMARLGRGVTASCLFVLGLQEVSHRRWPASPRALRLGWRRPLTTHVHFMRVRIPRCPRGRSVSQLSGLSGLSRHALRLSGAASLVIRRRFLRRALSALLLSSLRVAQLRKTGSHARPDAVWPQSSAPNCNTPSRVRQRVYSAHSSTAREKIDGEMREITRRNE